MDTILLIVLGIIAVAVLTIIYFLIQLSGKIDDLLNERDKR